MKKLFLLLSFSLSLTSFAFSQDKNVMFTKENFPNDAHGLTLAISEIKEGERLMMIGENMLKKRVSDIRYNANTYDYIRQGIVKFLRAYDFNPNSGKLNYVLGKSYLYINQPDEAIKFITRAMALHKEEAVDAYILLGQAYHLKGEFDKSIKSYEEALKTETSLNNIDKIKLLMSQANYAKMLINSPQTIRVENMGATINSAASEYLPISTDKNKAVVFQRYENGQNKYYVSFRDGNSWTEAQPTNQYFNMSAKQFYITKTLVDNKNQPLSTRLFYIDYPYGMKEHLYETLVSIAPDGKTGYLTSSRCMYDACSNGSALYETKVTANGKWTERPKSMGLKLNSQMDQFGVALHPNGRILYFSSNGYETMGGFDIYQTVFDGNEWSTPKNMEYPINSTANDIIYDISEDGQTLFIASNRTDGFGDYDLYTIDLSKSYTTKPVLTAEDTSKKKQELQEVKSDVPKVQYPAAIRGFVTDLKTYKPMVGVTVNINDVMLNQEELLKTDNAGMFQTTLPTGASYVLTINKEGYKPFNETFTIGDERGQRITQYYKLTPIEQLTPVSTTADATSAANASDTLAKTDNTTAVSTTPIVSLTTAPVAYVDGHVINEATGKPLSPATITARDLSSGMEQTVTADKNGYFKTSLVADHPYTLSITAPNYQPYMVELSPLDNGEKIAKNIYLKPIVPVAVTAHAQGSITDAETGKGLPFTTILVKDLATNKEQKITTDSKGRFNAPIPAGHPYSLTVQDSNYEPFSKEFDKATTGQNIVLGLKKAVPVTVAAATPVTNNVTETTNVEEAKGTPVVPVVIAPVVTTSPTNAEKATAPAANVPTAYVDGHILNDETGAPMSPVTVTVKDLATGAVQSVVTDKNGYFKTSIAADHPCEMTMTATGYQPYTIALTPLDAGQKTTKDAYLKPIVPVATTAYVKGTLVDSQTNTPLSFVPVRIKDLTDNKEQQVMTNSKGEFLTTIPAGHPYSLTVEAPNYKPYTTEIKAADGQTTAISLIPATPVSVPVTAITTEPAGESSTTNEEPSLVTIGGHISDNSNNKPLQGIHIAIKDQVTGQELQTITDNEGNFTSTIPVGNPYTITANADGYEPSITEMPAMGDNATSAVSITLQPTTVVPAAIAAVEEDTVAYMNGTVMDEISNKPLVAANVIIKDLVTGHELHTTTNKEGVFEATTPAYNAYTVTVEKPGYQPFVSEMPSYGPGVSMGMGIPMQPAAKAPALTANATNTKTQDKSATAATTTNATTAKPATTDASANKGNLSATTATSEKTTPVKYDKLVLTIYFDLDRAGLTDEEIAKIAHISDAVRSNAIQLVGYTDEVGGKGYNYRLTERRMDAILSQLLVNNIARKKVATTIKYQKDKSLTSTNLPVRLDDNHVEVWIKTK